MSAPTLSTRTPDDVGYIAWALHRLSALALFGLLALHVGVQLYPQYGFDAVYGWGIYGGLLDVTLGVVLLHGFLGVRATVLEAGVSDRTKATLVWFVGLLALGLFAYRVVL